MDPSNGETDDLNGLIFNSYYLPEEVVACILSYVDPNSLVFRCRRVCKIWKDIIDEEVWKLRLRSTQFRSLSKLSPAEKITLKLPWFIYYAIFTKDPFEKNLIKNHCGQQKAKYWSIQKPRYRPNSRRLGNGCWEVETVPLGCDPLPKYEDFENYTSCFVTSFEHCEKSQIIKLKDYGITKKIMDEYQPTITASEWYAGRFDCGGTYQMTVRLLDREKNTLWEKESAKKMIDSWGGSPWEKVQLTFDNYGPNVRFIEFIHKGQDNKYWAGHYGSKISGAVLKISLPRSCKTSNEL